MIKWYRGVLNSLQLNENKFKILVLSTQRTGSSYFVSRLYDAFYECNDDRHVHEYFHPKRLMSYLDKFQCNFDEYFEEISSSQEIFIAKCHVDHLMEMKVLGYNIFERFDCVCYLERIDKTAQARSRAIARKTKFWTTYTKKDNVWSASHAMKENGIDIPTISKDEIDAICVRIQNDIHAANEYLRQVQHVYQFESYTTSDDQINEFVSIIENLILSEK